MSGFTLHDILTEIRELIANGVDLETGEMSDEVSAELDNLEVVKEEKLIGYAVVWKELEAEKKALSNEATLLTRRANRLATRQRWLEGRLDDVLPNIKGIRLKDVRAQVSKVRSEATVIDNALALPRKLLRFPEKPPPEPIKADVRKALLGKMRLTPTQKEQLDSSGARIVERFKLKIE